MSTAPADSVSQLVGLQTAKYFTIAASALLVFDYCITFQSEVHWIWGRRWDVTRIMFTISRYLTFAAAFMTSYAAVKNRDGENCIPYGHASNAIHIISIISAEGLLILRTYAFWQGNKKVLASLLVLGVACIIGSVSVSAFVVAMQSSVAGMVLPLKRSLDPESPPAATSSGCIFESSRSSAYQYFFLVLYESVLLGMTVYKRQSDYRYLDSSLLTALYRDGVMYILCILLLSVTNIIVAVVVPIGYSNMTDGPQIVTHSILASRILFSLRQVHTNMVRQDVTGTTFVLSPINTGR
ncbi:hypothetical protein BV22DRAFT_1132265 [Leucogyrophana mollusca]|uniref:Uncharacterized protein n=1 Tax=Leucogyrophana mollusca TaxID=85980 RepID=A0ACB8B6K7_9AGAM|nr:hypothetical protein BV22DRAFT_1132265 [Leucogyrophana mollusca]